MISYRTLKKLVGESSLERKCRFLFGLALLTLITASFWFYASRTQRLVEYQQLLAARMLVPRLLQLRHYSILLPSASDSSVRKTPSGIGNPEGDVTESENSGVIEAVPATDMPDSDMPDSDMPDSDVPDSDVPDSDVPESDSAEVSTTDSGASGVSALSGIERSLPDSMVQSSISLFNRVLDELPATAERAVWSLTSATNELPESEIGFEARRRFLDEDNPENEYFLIRPSEGERPRELVYFAAIRIESACRRCHRPDGTVQRSGDVLPSVISVMDGTDPLVVAVSGTPASSPVLPLKDQTSDGQSDGTGPDLSSRQGLPLLSPDGRNEVPPLHSIAKITISLATVDAQLRRNQAILLATGIVTAFLAMLAAYAIVRYIIVKPVQHLKDVSDEIARGNLNLRADISTGDEFEELSHAFNRMLRHMMTVNDELRSLNVSLDGKIDQLAQANMELFNNNRLKDDFLATISHELRTPLNSILGFSDILHGASNLDERQKRYVHNIQTSGQSLMVQINDLLDLAKIESGKMDINRNEVSLGDILEQQMQQIMPLADRKNIDLRIDPPVSALPVMHQDRNKIIQILTNLLSNAIKFTPEGGRVRIASRQVDAAMVEFSVEDTGIGIPLQEQEHIFEKFRQGSTAPGLRDHVKREYEGTGLGLSIVRELARLLGGDVSLQSEFGRGSLFTVRLPVVAPERKKSEDDEPLPESRSSPGVSLITTVDLLTPAEESGRSPDAELSPLDIQSI